MATTVAPGQPVVVEGLTKRYPNGVEALGGISFTVEQGEIFGLLGPNGAGKTTTLGVLTTLVRPTGGSASVDGHDVTTASLAVRRSIGVVFQESVLDNEYTGEQNLRFHARLWDLPDAGPRIAELLGAVGLADRAGDPAKTYSGGMRRRLEIARALLVRPRVLFLDEPTLGLDPVVRSELWQLIRDLKAASGVTVVVSTHYLEEVEQVCDRVATIDRGHIVATGNPSQMVADLGRHILELRLADVAAAGPVLDALRTHPLGARPPLQVGTTITVASDEDREALGEQSARLGLSALGVTATVVRPATLNDVFLNLTVARAAAVVAPSAAAPSAGAPTATASTPMPTPTLEAAP
jgi:ABC-2 type transport system ATP-binding protein